MGMLMIPMTVGRMITRTGSTKLEEVYEGLVAPSDIPHHKLEHDVSERHPIPGPTFHHQGRPPHLKKPFIPQSK